MDAIRPLHSDSSGRWNYAGYFRSEETNEEATDPDVPGGPLPVADRAFHRFVRQPLLRLGVSSKIGDYSQDPRYRLANRGQIGADADREVVLSSAYTYFWWYYLSLLSHLPIYEQRLTTSPRDSVR